MSAKRAYGLVALGALLTAAGLVWLYLALGSEDADHLSSGIGAGATVVGALIAVLGLTRANSRSTTAASKGQSVENSVINGSNIQVGGSVFGDIASSGKDATNQDEQGEPN